MCCSAPQANHFAVERNTGLHVIAWNDDGSVFDFSVFAQYTPLRAFVDGNEVLVRRSAVLILYNIF